MKTTILKFSFIVGLLGLLIACSTKKDTFLARNTHALSTKYNILYNGDLALQTGITDLKSGYNDNFWQRLPVERMQILPAPEDLGAVIEKNPNFERAETKAIKAIQKHSMNIGGSEKNPQMDEAHLMLGKARYYDQRFVPALEAFNYVLYKYPESDKIYEVKIWREKTNMRMENDALAVKNLRKLLSEIEFKDQIYADANATLAQAFLNLEQKDSAIAKLQLAAEFTKLNEEQARYYFILGQLNEEIGQQDSAYVSYQRVIDMHRKSPRQYVIRAHARQANQFDYAKGDTLQFTEKFNKLLADRENRPYLDVLNHQMAIFYDKNKMYDKAVAYYNTSLDTYSGDDYLAASNFRNLAEINFDAAQYVTAGHYYDSTMAYLEPRSREFIQIRKKRENLVDVIKYEEIAQRNDSIINVYNMPAEARIAYYSTFIDKIRKEDEERKALEQQIESRNDVASLGTASGARIAPQTPGGSKAGDFYFYNATTVAYGKTEFRKNWGDRAYVNNWRRSSNRGNNQNTTNAASDPLSNDSTNANQDLATADERYSPDFYISKLPKSKAEIDVIVKDRNFAYYQLGVIYKEKFKEYALAAQKLEQLLANNPEERLVLPSLYNLYKIYELTDSNKAAAMRSRIISQHPDSRYAQILRDSTVSGDVAQTPESAYNNLYKVYESGDYKKVYVDVETAIERYTGEEIAPKFELLKAHTIGKLFGIAEYKKALNYVALSYPNNPEGKDAEALLRKDIILLENLQFNDSEPTSWKILYRAANAEDKNSKLLQQKLQKFAAERTAQKLSTSFDLYTMQDNFIALHGMISEEQAIDIATILRDYKEYKIADTPIIISSNNYRIVQIRKNLDEYLADPKKPANKSGAPAVDNPQQEEQFKLVNRRPIKAQQSQRQSTLPTSSSSSSPAMNPNNASQSARGNSTPPGIAAPPMGDDAPEPKRR